MKLTSIFLFAMISIIGSASAEAKCFGRDQEIMAGRQFSPGNLDVNYCSGYRFVFQGDGNLVIYGPDQKPTWSSNTHNQNADTLIMQADGNLVIYAGQDALWNSGTHGNPGAFTRFQMEGNLVVYAGPKGAVYASNGSTSYHTLDMRYHGEKAKRQYCDSRVFVHPNGSVTVSTIFSNGQKFDGDHYLSFLEAKYPGGKSALKFVQSVGLSGAVDCSGSCERHESATSDTTGLDHTKVDWKNAKYQCVANKNSVNDDLVGQIAIEVAKIIISLL